MEERKLPSTGSASVRVILGGASLTGSFIQRLVLRSASWSARVRKFSAPGDLFDQVHYLESLLFCLPTGMAEQPSAATGQVMRPATLRRYAMEASFRGVEILPIEHPRMRIYRLFP